MPLGVILYGLAGAIVLAASVLLDAPVSMGSLLGVLLLASALARYLHAREA